MRRQLTLWPLVFALAAGCGDEKTDLLRDGEVVAVLTPELSRDIDLLFVVDNSGGLSEAQDALLSGFPALLDELSALEGGEVDGALPNLHIGVVSTDMGAGPFNISGCSGRGDDGRLQSAPRRAGCTPPNGAFISDIELSGGERETNYVAPLDETFACIARLGIDGCGFEQPLESLRQALDGGNAENAGFLREDAWLAVVILTDEDDCSASNTQMYDTSQDTIDDPLGPLSSYRCFEFGVVCEPDEPRVQGVKTGCRARADSEYMYDVRDYAQFLHGIKNDPSQVFVAGIIGDPTPVEVGGDQNGDPELEASCAGPANQAVPGIRLAELLQQFPARSTLDTICTDDLSAALSRFGRRLREVISSAPCLDGPVSQPVRCAVEDAYGYGTEFEQRTELPACDTPGNPGGSGNQPCYVIAADRTTCPESETGLAITTYPADRELPGGTRVVVKCAVN